MPNGFTARYTITNQTTGKVVEEYAQVNKEYAVPPGEYIIEMVEIYGEGSHQNFNYVSTNTAIVNVGSGDRKTATVTSTYERAGGNNTDVYLVFGNSPYELSSTSVPELTVPINSKVILKYHDIYIDHGNYTEHDTPKWQLYGWDGNSWGSALQEKAYSSENETGVELNIGEAEKYCVVLVTNNSNRKNEFEASLTPGAGSANGQIDVTGQEAAPGDSYVNTAESVDTADTSKAANAHGSTLGVPFSLKTLFSPIVT